MPFSALGLSPTLRAALQARDYLTPTTIQLRVIPAVLQRRDVLGCAQTGSGKTLAFVLPLLQQIEALAPERPRTLRILVLLPTRELCAQVGEEFRALARSLERSVKVTVAFGGVSVNPQLLALRGGSDIVVATPGRLLDLLAHNALQLDGVKTLVLDEADRLLELGFADELDRILDQLPPQRQNLFFSATFPSAVQALVQSLLNDPLRVEVPVGPAIQPADIRQRAIAVDSARRTQLLRHLIQHEGWGRVLVFVATKHAAEIVADKLRKARISAEPFHGQLSQGKRTQVLADFKASRVRVVVATDIAARGLDIALLPVVVNYDLPRSVVDYTHRVGRTGRAGASGLAVSLVSADNTAHFQLIQKRQHLQLALEQVAGFEPVEGVEFSAVARPAGGGVKGRRPSKKDKLRSAAARQAGAATAS